MSHDSEAPVLPVQAFEPPYSETADRMEELVKQVPGYLGMDHARTPGGLSITVGYFRDADALTRWRTNSEHRAAQKRERAEWYQSYSLHVAKVERSHTFTQEES
jgi:heme-degrading monooxygenase HmoA